MPMQNQEDDGNDEQLENEELDLPTSPSTHDSNTQTQKPFVIDDGPMLIDNPTCLELVTTLCEDKNDILVVCENTLTNESPTFFLNSPNNTIEEKFAYVEKYLCGLQLSLVPNLCCSHDIKLDIDLNNYFERGKHANEFQNKFNDPPCFPKLSKLNDSSGYMVEFASTTCNYYEKGGDENPLYATNN